MARHDPARIARLADKDPKSANGYVFFSDEETGDFYRGAAAASCSSVEREIGFLEGVSEDPPPLFPAFSAVLETIAVLACDYWVRRVPHLTPSTLLEPAQIREPRNVLSPPKSLPKLFPHSGVVAHFLIPPLLVVTSEVRKPGDHS